MPDSAVALEPKDRLCLWCKHMEADKGRFISDVTWESGATRCYQMHWYCDETANMNDLRSVFIEIQRAKTCPDFEIERGIDEYLTKSKALEPTC